MLYTQDVSEFISINETEIRKAVTQICNDYGMRDQIEDVNQTLYLKFVNNNILPKYDPNHEKHASIGSYVYTVIKSIAETLRTNKETYIEKGRIRHNKADSDSYYDEIEMLINTNGMAIDYRNTLYANYSTEPVDGLDLELNLFERFLETSNYNHHYSLNRRKCPEVDTKGLTLLDIFKYLRNGYSNKYISEKYGISNNFITLLKNDLKVAMIKFGFPYGCKTDSLSGAMAG